MACIMGGSRGRGSGRDYFDRNAILAWAQGVFGALENQKRTTLARGFREKTGGRQRDEGICLKGAKAERKNENRGGKAMLAII